MADYTNAAQQRLIRVLMVLFSDIVDGVPNSKIAREVGCTPTAVTRDLENLRTAGIAERDETTGRWLLTSRLPRQALTAMSMIDRRQQRLDEVRRRMSTTAL